MCGICGLVSGDVPTVEPAVRRMMAALTHRGPNAEGFAELPFGFDEGGPVLGLGFRRLAIVDLSDAGQQPMMNPATGDWLVFNGEVYNFRELKAQLSSAGAVFRSTSDTEVVLHALSRWKEDALPRLHGMFALAFFDAANRRLLLARDPLGIKPLYVSQQPDRLVFASEIRGLRASGLVPLDPDVAGIAGMLAYGAVQSPRTVYEKIRSFPAGHHQWFDAAIVSGRPPAAPRRFWAFPSEIAAPSSQGAAAEVTRLLRDSVARHLVADVPVGILLSAGIDSTAIAAFGREQSASLRAFTVGLGSLIPDNESPLAAATAAAHPHVQVRAAGDAVGTGRPPGHTRRPPRRLRKARRRCGYRWLRGERHPGDAPHAVRPSPRGPAARGRPGGSRGRLSRTPRPAPG
jgi:asparagine synthase (glutamine-hydrolysing)